MKTKLVYVLTCAPEATYIEQALMAVWSARYHNPDAHIVLLTDDKTSTILHADSPRGEILQYITEEIVTFFDEDKPMHYRSRWLKTKVRELVDGDLLFVDCDTICQKSLLEIDRWTISVGMEVDEHMLLENYTREQLNPLVASLVKIGSVIGNESLYFNSGVQFLKDKPIVHELFKKWHEYWLYGQENGVSADQPSLFKANIEVGHLIARLPGVWNCQVYMNPIFINDAYIIHYWSFRNKSFLYTNEMLNYVKRIGLTKYVKACILNSVNTMLPFDNMLTNYNVRDFVRLPIQLTSIVKKYCFELNESPKTLPWLNRLISIEQFFLEHGLIYFCFLIFSLRKFVNISLRGKVVNREIYYT